MTNHELNQVVSELQVPAEHVRMRLIDANETYLFGSRGSFKSSLGIPLYAIDRVLEMPKSHGVAVGLSFQHLYENTLPPFKAALLKWGFVEDVHFTISKPPPKDWPKPYAGVVDKKYSNAMPWYNGTHVQMISLMRKASANGVSGQWGFFDEVKFMKETELADEIFPIFRGNEEYFKHCSGYLSKFFATDKNADPVHIKWLLKKRKLVNQKKVDIVLALAIELRKLKDLYNGAGINKKQKLKPQIFAIETRLALLRANMVYVAEINADDVRGLLGEKWYQDKKRNSSAHEWKVIYLNEDPDRPGEAFYPAYSEAKHQYHAENDSDLDITKPLIISLDYQHTVAPLPVAQISTLPGRDKPSLNYINEFYTLYPEGLKAVVKKFCDYYNYIPLKRVYYVYDHTAIGKRADAKEYSKIVIEELEANGWEVVEIYTGQAPDHYQKYTDTIDWMENKDDLTMDIMINDRCEKLDKSIRGAAATTVRNETKKDKSLEKEKTLDQSETTHFSDAFDMTNDAVLKQELIKTIAISIPLGFR